MQKDKLSMIRDFIVKNCKIVFPVIVVAVVAFTVTIALNLNRSRSQSEDGVAGDGTVSGEDMAEVQMPAPEEVPLVENENAEITTLVNTFYNARESGDTETLSALYDMILTEDLLSYGEWSKYVDYYEDLQIYTKQGPVADSVVAYVYYKAHFVDYEEAVPGSENMYICRNNQGQLYIKNFKNENNFTEEENKFIETLNAQDDISELDNRVTVEFNEVIKERPELLTYLLEVDKVVQESVGLTLASQNVAGGNDNQDEPEENPEGGEPATTDEPPVDTTPEYATATTTVNVRSSDSEQADRLGRVSAGTRLQVQEVRINGWTKVVYEGADGFIKSEYLQFAESAAGQEVIGTVTATTNVNVRAAASQTADKLGTLVGGESLDLLAVEGEWCKVIFAGQIGYVKAEFVQQN